MLTLPPHPKLAQVRQVAETLGCPVYLVGGFVRDVLLGLPPDDFDVVVEGGEGGPRLARGLAQAFGGCVTVHKAFATATWFDEHGTPTDCITARTEHYPRPGQLPVVSTPAPIAADLTRRDFTLNAMAMRLDGGRFGELIDPFNGQADLRAGVIRVLHGQSFVDDPTRLFRAGRYEQRLGFQIAPETLALIPSGLAALPALTGDRLRHEFELIFNEPHAAQMLMRLDALGILAASHPALHWGIAETERIAGVDQWRWDKWKIERAPLWAAVWFGLLFRGNAPPEVRDGLRRLNLSKLPQDAITAGLQIQLPPAPSPSAVVQICEAHPASASVVAYACYPEWRVELHRFLSDWRWARAQTTGDDLIRRGLRPGPRFRAALWALRAARLDGETEAAGEAAWLDLWLKKN